MNKYPIRLKHYPIEWDPRNQDWSGSAPSEYVTTPIGMEPTSLSLRGLSLSLLTLILPLLSMRFALYTRILTTRGPSTSLIALFVRLSPTTAYLHRYYSQERN